MSNGDKEKEKEIVNGLKEIVKHTSRRKAVQPSRQDGGGLRVIAPNPLSGPSSLPTALAERQDDGTPGSVPDANQAAGDPDTKDDSARSQSIEELSLLMHFLDYVFPLQYPMYKPAALQGGRGWLLPLVLRSKPLYHAALAASAHHRRILLPGSASPSVRAASLVLQEGNLEVCIHLVNNFAQNSCPKGGLGIASALVQLVFYEVFLPTMIAQFYVD